MVLLRNWLDRSNAFFGDTYDARAIIRRIVRFLNLGSRDNRWRLHQNWESRIQRMVNLDPRVPGNLMWLMDHNPGYLTRLMQETWGIRNADELNFPYLQHQNEDDDLYD